VVRSGRSAILAGRHHYRTNKVPPRHLPIGPSVRSRGAGHHHLSTPAGPLTPHCGPHCWTDSPLPEIGSSANSSRPRPSGDVSRLITCDTSEASPLTRRINSYALSGPTNSQGTFKSPSPPNLMFHLTPRHVVPTASPRLSPGLNSRALAHLPPPTSFSNWRPCPAE
jgi:hypothetical protein